MASIISFIKEKNRTTPTWLKVLIPFLAAGGLAVVAVVAIVTAFFVDAWLGQPVTVLGFDHTFEQPIDFPHTIHAGMGQVTNSTGETVTGLGMDCTFCHRTVTTQAFASVPSVAICAYCHQVIGGADSAPLTELREHAGIVGESPSPVNWVRVHRLPDHVRFVHEPHIRYLTANPDAVRNAAPGVNESPTDVMPAQVCSTCHGNVAAMEQVQQVEPLKMGQCVNCHRDNGAPTDCATCHY